jgi:putative DNA primase/helicase
VTVVGTVSENSAWASPPDMVAAALEYLSREWPVFPVCHPVSRGRCWEHARDRHGADDVGKYPLVRWKRYQSEVPSEQEVRQWWCRWPNANIGLATGDLSGVAVVDLDGVEAQRQADRLRYDEGPWVTTGRVGGRHAYFAHRPDAPTIFAKTNGIDFRGQGGYVLLPPSLHRSGVRYAWGSPPLNGEPLPPLPRWINDLAPKARGPNGVAAVVLGGILERTRNETLLSFGGTMRHRGMSHEAIEAALLVENASRCKPPLEEDEVRRIAASVARYQPASQPLRLTVRVA